MPLKYSVSFQVFFLDFQQFLLIITLQYLKDPIYRHLGALLFLKKVYLSKDLCNQRSLTYPLNDEFKNNNRISKIHVACCIQEIKKLYMIVHYLDLVKAIYV